MDILVTTPKNETRNARLEAEELSRLGGHYFRVFKFRPNMEIGERMYFVQNGLITGYGIVLEVSQLAKSQLCETTGRFWGMKGNWKVSYDRWSFLVPCIQFKGFQGIRYIDRIPGLREQLRSIEKGGNEN